MMNAINTFFVITNLVGCAWLLGIYAWSPGAENAHLSVGIFCGVMALFLSIQGDR